MRKRKHNRIHSHRPISFKSLAIKSRVADVLLEPWFLPRNLSASIRHLLPNDYGLRMRYFFDDYGCLVCRQRNVNYAANGMCDTCRNRVGARVLRSLRKRIQRPPVIQKEQKEKLHEFRRAKASELLAELADAGRNLRSARKAPTSKSWRREKIQMPFGVVEFIT